MWGCGSCCQCRVSCGIVQELLPRQRSRGQQSSDRPPMRREKYIKTAVFPSFPPPEGKTWYSTTEGVTIAISPAQRELALKNLEEQGLPRPKQFDDEPGENIGGYSDPGDDPESPGCTKSGSGSGNRGSSSPLMAAVRLLDRRSLASGLCYSGKKPDP